jgi:CheY-like chemotaxis protein
MKFLESAGHQTEIVENGALALEAVKKNFYDVRLSLLSRYRDCCSRLRSIDCPDGSLNALDGRETIYALDSSI